MNLDNRLSKIYFLFFFFKKILRYFFFKNKNIYDFDVDKKINDLKNYLQILKNTKTSKKTIALLCLENFEFYFFYVWILLSSYIKFKDKIDYLVISNKQNCTINNVCKLLKIKIYFIEDILIKQKDILIPISFQRKINNAKSLNDFLNLKYANFELGKMAISNFCRIHRVGFVNFRDQFQAYLIKRDTRNIYINLKILEKNKVINNCDYFFSFEKNLIPYLYFYLLSVYKKKIFIHWSSSNVNINSFILRKNIKNNFYKHHSSLESLNFSILKRKKIINGKLKKSIFTENKKIIKKRYFSTDSPFSVNLIEVDNHKKIKEKKNKKNCIIFSHILHDTLYFFGDEIYDSYAHWLVETVKIACKNKKINWYIKFHPSNIYRGEFKKGRSKEEDIIRQEIKEIPPHIKFIYPNTEISPWDWLNFADYGITIRGTAGLEMSILGKPVILAGRNRYENNGFGILAKNKKDYKNLMMKLPVLNKRERNVDIQKANLYFYGVFKKKCFDFVKLKIIKNIGKFSWSKVNFNMQKSKKFDKNFTIFRKFLLDKNSKEFFK